jgi:hypothetical protein
MQVRFQGEPNLCTGPKMPSATAAGRGRNWRLQAVVILGSGELPCGYLAVAATSAAVNSAAFSSAKSTRRKDMA